MYLRISFLALGTQALSLTPSLSQSMLFVIIAEQNYNWMANGENANEKIAMDNACTCLFSDPIESHVIGQPINFIMFI